MDLGLSGMRALVTGGSRGLGAGIARVLAAEGVRLAVAARGSAELDALTLELGASGIPIDLSTLEGPAASIAAAQEALGGLDLLVVNSGGPPPGGFRDLDDEAWQKAIDGTLWSSLRLLRASLPLLEASSAPAIVVVLSSSVREPIPSLTTSNVLRPGLAGLIKSLLPEIAPIRINGIAPGRVATQRIAGLDERRAQEAGVPIEEIRRQTTARIPLGRYGEALEVGRVGAFLLSPAASYVNGAIVAVDGGMIRSLP
ncbi:MAG: 3-oxoacyl-[acyl-carrier protein] reductase [Chloroflexota bacterium]|jgi:3-oxoacyl-[acyl-carrier protein] reductase|nr:3-oxoacyl-[acyl-carrier protein] reductase [Chloroflexota bacterium]MEA2607693.1 3-oxoacyl-[acyl-carrier protein] reductase [Chloroflexota bacterium]